MGGQFHNSLVHLLLQRIDGGGAKIRNNSSKLFKIGAKAEFTLSFFIHPRVAKIFVCQDFRRLGFFEELSFLVGFPVAFLASNFGTCHIFPSICVCGFVSIPETNSEFAPENRPGPQK